MSMHFPMPTALPLPPMSRRAIEDQIELLIAMLDATDGDPESEDDNEDCCPGWDDDARMFSLGRIGYDSPLQDPDAEPDDDDEEDDWPGGNVDDEPQAAEGEDYYRLLPTYGVDQSLGPLNHSEAEQARQRDMGWPE